jgi:hypothetical protein
VARKIAIGIATTRDRITGRLAIFAAIRRAEALAARPCVLLIEGCGLQLMDRTKPTERGRMLL